MFKLLPHYFKKIGLILAPTGLTLWIIMQKGLVLKFSEFIQLQNPRPLNITVAVLGMLFFLFGIYALAFSKEKIEDEMIKNIRLESFRFAALVQIVLITLGVFYVGMMEQPPKDAGMMLFFITAILIFCDIVFENF